MAGLGREIVRRGHEVVFAGQQIGSMPAGGEIWQAPLWPGQLTTLARRAATMPATMGDILAILGLGDSAAVAAMIGAWDRIMAATRPDVVIAEFAPALTMAAYGRSPLLALGTGFSLPPADLPRFPSLTGQPTVHDEIRLLEGVNDALARQGRARRESLPGIFQADRELAAVFTELDPYRPWRKSAPGAPSSFLSTQIASGEGEELFFYMNGREARPNALWQGLVRSGLKVRIHDPGLSPADREVLIRAGLIVEPHPIAFDLIVQRSRLLMSHGGLGFVSSGLLAGLPQIVIPFDIEKHMISAGLQERGLGHRYPLEGMQADRLAELLQSAFADDSLLAHSRAAAPAFRARRDRDADQEAVDAAEALVP
jgi:hypothetical protein